MSTPHFLINVLLAEHKMNYPDNSLENIIKLKKTLFEKGVLTKDFLEDKLMLLYHKYDTPITTELERECRSLIIDLETLKMKSYSCESPRLNKEGMEFMVVNSTEDQIITTCYEGTYLSLFHHNDKWYISTRRCLDSNKSIFTNGDTPVDQSHFNMFEEILKKAGYNDFDNFCSCLDTNKSYYFVLIHHKNKHTIDYTSEFGEEYGRVCLTTIRDANMCELDIYDDNNQDLIKFILNVQNILFVPPKHTTTESFCEKNKNYTYDFTVVPDSEGIIIRIWSSTLQKYNLIKLQNANYQLAQVVGTEQNIFKGILYLYQIDKLANYFANNSHNNFNKMVNPINTNETYDTVGIVDAVFKVCTSELFVLFKILWSLKNGQHQNKNLYNILPKEYKDILFGIKGLYYKKKSANYKKDGKPVTYDNIKASHLKLNDIYNYLKNLPIEQLIAFIRMRKLMFNWVRQYSNESIESIDSLTATSNTTGTSTATATATTTTTSNTAPCKTNLALQDFNTISAYCDKVHIKLCAIFTHKLYPNIMLTDIPPQKTTNNLLDSIIQ